MFRESLKVFLHCKKWLKIKTEIFEIRVKYKVSTVEEFGELYKKRGVFIGQRSYLAGVYLVLTGKMLSS